VSYRFSGWMKGRDIPSGAECQLSLSFFSSKVPMHGLDRDFLAAELDAYVAWGRRRDVPLYLGEWGSIRQSFEGDRGGLRWAEDMLDLLAERRLHFAFHDYHEDAMGLYWGEGSCLSRARNQPLIELFTRKLEPAAPVASESNVSADAGAPPPRWSARCGVLPQPALICCARARWAVLLASQAPGVGATCDAAQGGVLAAARRELCHW
jgi:hypothetical protein